MQIFTNHDTGFTYIGRLEDDFEQVQFKTVEQLCYNEVFLVIDFARVSMPTDTALEKLRQLADSGVDVKEIRQLVISPFVAYYRCSSINRKVTESIKGKKLLSSEYDGDLIYYEVVGDRLPCHPDSQIPESQD